MLPPPTRANRAIWSMRKRHEWLATPLKKRRVKRGTRVRCGLQDALDPLGPVKITRLPRAFIIESEEAPGPLLEAVQRAAVELEERTAAAYPVLHHEIGHIWTGTLQAVFA